MRLRQVRPFVRHLLSHPSNLIVRWIAAGWQFLPAPTSRPDHVTATVQIEIFASLSNPALRAA